MLTDQLVCTFIFISFRVPNVDNLSFLDNGSKCGLANGLLLDTSESP